MNTAASEIVIDRIVNAISFEPSNAASQRRLAPLHVPDDVLQHDDRVVDDEADRERERHEREVVERVAEQPHMTANVPTIDTGSARLGMTVAGRFRRNRKMTRTTSTSVSSSVNCTSSTDVADRLGAVVDDLQLDRGGELLR